MRKAIHAIQEDWSVRHLNMACENEREEERGGLSQMREGEGTGWLRKEAEGILPSANGDMHANTEPKAERPPNSRVLIMTFIVCVFAPPHQKEFLVGVNILGDKQISDSQQK